MQLAELRSGDVIACTGRAGLWLKVVGGDGRGSEEVAGEGSWVAFYDANVKLQLLRPLLNVVRRVASTLHTSRATPEKMSRIANDSEMMSRIANDALRALSGTTPTCKACVCTM